MKKYEYVGVDIDNLFSSGNYKHREIIDEYASKGYKYVGYIPGYINNKGRMISMDLIFEIEE